MRIYLSGAISNDKNFKEKFEYWKNKLKEKYPDSEIVNPVEIGETTKRVMLPLQNELQQWHDFMIHDLIELKYCTHIFFIPESTESVGRGIERLWSKKIKIEEVTL